MTRLKFTRSQLLNLADNYVPRVGRQTRWHRSRRFRRREHEWSSCERR